MFHPRRSMGLWPGSTQRRPSRTHCSGEGEPGQCLCLSPDTAVAVRTQSGGASSKNGFQGCPRVRVKISLSHFPPAKSTVRAAWPCNTAFLGSTPSMLRLFAIHHSVLVQPLTRLCFLFGHLNIFQSRWPCSSISVVVLIWDYHCKTIIVFIKRRHPSDAKFNIL